MLALRLQILLARWLLAVMLLGALAPTVSRALAASQGQRGVSWMEVCTGQGMQKVAVPDSKEAPDKNTVVVDHCPLCVLTLDRLAPPTQAFVWQALPRAPPEQAARVLPFVAHARPWTALSRAPPFSS